jgi:hypothetical protein
MDEFLLFIRQLFGQLELDFYIQITFFAALHVWEPVTGHTHFGPRLGSGWDFKAELFVVKGGH